MFALYVHWPFCLSKCPYCDFNSHAGAVVEHQRWRRALLAELDHFAGETKGRTVTSIFFGGGTPSLMEPATVGAVIEAAGKRWRLADDVEITLEANPTSSETGRFKDFRAAGVNRLSLGVQAFDDRALRVLGRTHSASDAKAAIGWAAAAFPRTSFDLIAGRPGQTGRDWEQELAGAAALAGDHLSVYQLTIEPGAEFHRRGIKEADEDLAISIHEITQGILGAARIPAYEVSNHARPGGECRHNLTYWRGGDYVGIGPGAHGRITGSGGTEAVHQIRDPERWLESVETAGHGTAGRTLLSAEERRAERVLTGLRLTEGIGRDLCASLPFEPLVEAGLLIFDSRGLRTTPAGRLCLNSVVAELLR